MKRIVFIFFIITSLETYAQTPVINSITPISSYAGNQLLITGSGFSSTPSQLQVWFDQVNAAITSSSENSIVVTVPSQARLGNIEVLNVVSHLSAKASVKFVPSFGGNDFDPSKLGGATSFPGGTNEIFDICSCDFDGDGKPDLAATKQGTATDIMLQKNNSVIGALTFTGLSLPTSSPMFNLACGDLDGDGRPELVASRGGATRNEIFIYRNTSNIGTISFAAVTKLFLDAGQFAFRISIRDLNLDGKPELIVSNSNVSSTGNVIYVFTNQSSGGSLSFNATPIKLIVTGATTTYGLDVQDLDGDKKPEIILNQFNNSDVFIIPNLSSNALNFGAVQKITLAGTLNHLTSADFNEDGKLDLVVTSSFENKVYLLLNTSSIGQISFATPLSFGTGDGPYGIDVSDIDGDDDIDIIVGNIDLNTASANTELTVLRNNGNNLNPAFTTLNIDVGKKSRNVRVGDLDGDGKPEIAFTTVTSNSLDILRNTNCFVPQIINAAPITICTGQTIRLNAKLNTGATIFDWQESTTSFASGANAFVDITTAGNYTVTATSESGNCLTTSSVLSVTSGSGVFPPNPTSGDLISNSPVCTSNPLNLSTSLTGSFTYEWEGPNGFTSTLQNPSIASVSESNGGNYTLKLVNGTCKTSPIAVLVDIVNLQNFNISSSSASNIACENEAISLSLNAQPDYTFQWIKDGSDLPGKTGGTLDVTNAGVYKARVTNTVLGCSAETASQNISIVALPIVDFSVKATACVNETVIFSNASKLDPAATPTLSWDFGDTKIGNGTSISHSYTSAQAFNTSLTISYSNVANCSASLTKNIAIVSPVVPTLTSTDDGLCENSSLTINVAGSFTTINWNTTDAGSSLKVTTPGTYTVNTIDQNGCVSSAQIVIATKDSPQLTVSSDKTTLVIGQSAQLTAGGASSYLWSPAKTLNDSLVANPIATPLETTIYTVTGIASNGCKATQSITIDINSELSALRIPNVFSPNGDSFNDIWIIPGIEAFSDCTLSLYDKSGRKILEQKGYMSDWEGTYGGQSVPEGTYYYVIGCPDKKQRTGNVLVAR